MGGCYKIFPQIHYCINAHQTSRQRPCLLRRQYHLKTPESTENFISSHETMRSQSSVNKSDSITEAYGAPPRISQEKNEQCEDNNTVHSVRTVFASSDELEFVKQRVLDLEGYIIQNCENRLSRRLDSILRNAKEKLNGILMGIVRVESLLDGQELLRERERIEMFGRSSRKPRNSRTFENFMEYPSDNMYSITKESITPSAGLVCLPGGVNFLSKSPIDVDLSSESKSLTVTEVLCDRCRGKLMKPFTVGEEAHANTHDDLPETHQLFMAPIIGDIRRPQTSSESESMIKYRSADADSPHSSQLRIVKTQKSLTDTNLEDALLEKTKRVEELETRVEWLERLLEAKMKDE